MLLILPGSGLFAQDDADGDMLSDDDENNMYFTNPFEPDSDWDGDWDGDEIANGTDPNDPTSNSGSGGGGGGTDTDGDGLSDDDENNLFGTNPYDTDTDLDGFEDGEEVDQGTDPNDPDSYQGSGGGGSGGGPGEEAAGVPAAEEDHRAMPTVTA